MKTIYFLLCVGMVDRIQKDNSDVIPNRCGHFRNLDDQKGEESLKREYVCKFLSDYCEAIGILHFVQDDKHK